MQDAFETLNNAMAKVRETGWFEFQSDCEGLQVESNQ